MHNMPGRAGTDNYILISSDRICITALDLLRVPASCKALSRHAPTFSDSWDAEPHARSPNPTSLIFIDSRMETQASSLACMTWSSWRYRPLRYLSLPRVQVFGPQCLAFHVGDLVALVPT